MAVPSDAPHPRQPSPEPPAPTGSGSAHVRYTFDEVVPMDEARGTLELARLATESLHGPGRVALEATCRVDRAARSIFIDITTDAGRTLALVFGGYVEKEFGSAVHLCRVEGRGA